ncbi:hypothetical protein BKA70DRAFT_1220753 [Coprinopsis sp. MPI-PUGE-AT-0042]|nr:hypothetical protein BKA70DRAFT_1220753 [Coprinopsis sp. MPI-PUGE-AT-0042]
MRSQHLLASSLPNTHQLLIQLLTIFYQSLRPSSKRYFNCQCTFDTPSISFAGTNNGDSVAAETAIPRRVGKMLPTPFSAFFSQRSNHLIPFSDSLDFDPILSRLPSKKSRKALPDMNSITVESEFSPRRKAWRWSGIEMVEFQQHKVDGFVDRAEWPRAGNSYATIESAVRLLDFKSEAFQAALSFADDVEAWTFVVGAVKLKPLKMKLMLSLGEKMARAFGRRIPTSYALLLLIAVKACVTYWTTWFIDSWYPFEWGRYDFLRALRGCILDAGNKCATHSWRSTRKALPSLTTKVHPQRAAYPRGCTHKVHIQPTMGALNKASEDALFLPCGLAIRPHYPFEVDVAT